VRIENLNGGKVVLLQLRSNTLTGEIGLNPLHTGPFLSRIPQHSVTTTRSIPLDPDAFDFEKWACPTKNCDFLKKDKRWDCMLRSSKLWTM